MERIRMIDAAREIIKKTGHDAVIKTNPPKPTGPYNRFADNTLSRKLLGWSPQVGFNEGLDRVIRWYFDYHDVMEIRGELQQRLTAR